ncbi:MAG: cytochrome c1 [Proteobacteria bacterium]|nr:cytochrome c1 [Pseudomonadota bacterium]
MRRLHIGLIALAVAFGAPGARAAEHVDLLKSSWSFGGLFGTYDRAAAQRGFKVYKEVCATCHALSLISFRNLGGPGSMGGGIGFSGDEVKAIAADYKVMDGPNDAGEMFERPARPSDFFPKPFPNEKAARANNNGAYPPDLSLITKARADGANYLFSLLQGYSDPPAGVKLMEGMNYNKYFAAGDHQIAMPQPLQPNQVAYDDGTASSLAQEAHDVATFLSWAAEPELEARRRIGLEAILFLIVLTAMLYGVKRKVWAAVH